MMLHVHILVNVSYICRIEHTTEDLSVVSLKDNHPYKDKQRRTNK